MSVALKKVKVPEFQKIPARRKSGGRTGAYGFAHNVDALIIKTLDNPAINTLFERFVQVSIDATFGLNLAQGIPISRDTMPELYAALRHCSETLGIPLPYTIVSSSLNGVNAMTSGTDEFAFIAVSSLIPVLFDVDEQRFIIGHECGHLALGHVVYHTAVSTLGNAAQIIPIVGPAIANMITFPLNAWSRRSELSADRAGLICCGDLDTALQMLVKLELGLAALNFARSTPAVTINAADYVKAARNVLKKNMLGKYGELLHSHPLLPKRVEALELFSQSEMYYRFAEKERPEGIRLLSDDELHRRTEQIVKVIE